MENPQVDAHEDQDVSRADPSEIGRALARLRWDAPRAEPAQPGNGDDAR